VACGNEVVVVAALLVEGAKLDEAVAHDIRVGCQSCAYLIHGVLRHLVPIFAVAVDDFELAAILMADGCRHLQVFLRGTVPLLFLFRAYLDIETVGLQSLADQLVKYHAGVYPPAE
jgi:hypothetical protein